LAHLASLPKREGGSKGKKEFEEFEEFRSSGRGGSPNSKLEAHAI
jgi:hypothetical protein